MSQTAEFPVPDGYFPPFSIVSDHDHGGWIIIATSLGLTMALLSTVVRVYVKVVSRQAAGMDDVLLAAATLFAFTEQSVILAACARGLGRSVDLLQPNALRDVEKSFYSSQILTVLALGLCKCSCACFIMRLTPKSTMKRTMQSIICGSVAWMAAAILAFALQCDLNNPWSFSAGTCNNVYTRVIAICVFDIILELALFVSAILLVFGLSTGMHKKLVVVLAFGLRLPIVAFIAARMATFNRHGLTDLYVHIKMYRLGRLLTSFAGGSARSESLYIIWTVTQINYSLISATLPIFRPFIKDLSTYYGAGHQSEYGCSSQSRSNSYPLTTFKMRRSDTAKGSRGSAATPQDQSLAKDNLISLDFGAAPLNRDFQVTTHCEADVHSGPSNASEDPHLSSHSLGSNDSQRMIIRVDNEWTVDSEERAI